MKTLIVYRDNEQRGLARKLYNSPNSNVVMELTAEQIIHAYTLAGHRFDLIVIAEWVVLPHDVLGTLSTRLALNGSIVRM